MKRPLLSLVCSAAVFGSAIAVADTATEAQNLLNQRCSACHARLPDGGLARISQMRKTPEGWDMTLVRMRIWHGVKLSSEEQQTLVQYLADRQGLAPAESAPFRYALERRPNAVEPDYGELGVMCARCHSFARLGLQHRDREEWIKLVHMHVGQWPTIEYSALGRDRNWFEIAIGETAKALGEQLPLATEAWQSWSKDTHKSPEGTWRIVGHQPGAGDFHGSASVSRDGEGYRVQYRLSYVDGSTVEGAGTASLYTGYEWRGASRVGDEHWREVLALSADGRRIAGRVFRADADEIGADIQGVRSDGQPEILAVTPGYLKAGQKATLTVHGIGLAGAVELGPDVTVGKVVSRSADSVTVEAEAAADAAAGARSVAVGDTRRDAALVVYSRLDSVRIEPDYALGRVGGGSTPPVTAQFEAVGYLNGPDGQPGTEDDVRVGVFPAEWSTADFNEAAAEMKDAHYAGRIDPRLGLFIPAGAGPNPERKYGTNNAGDLKVVAKVADGERTLEGSGRLIVTVQRWNDPPIR
ncbi:MAG TPA: quinohemoprotein amine dehydrogenase subunit alpha [Candidatus Competibacteraceae bacterium]|nr:quinohemoprotein amine dehydrogenase subunit alpha [Candidatus Competibacteraceae bacterium]